ncbi:MAG: B12-binding domain-containing radical SAM protein [Deltaproteobacteria bacterium]|nr:B12-binding domain-containing radical SAM protein [Deltaproteobacteria bacterium]
MKVAVIAPPYPLEEAPAPPLGVSYVAAAFEAAGCHVKIIDYIVSRYTPEKLKKELDAFEPDVVGSTSVTMNFPAAADIIRTAKRHRPSILTIMGGPHVSFAVADTLETYPEIDMLVVGEGEKTIMELVPHMIERGSWPDIKGLAFRQGGGIVVTEQRELISDLDSIPMPARHLLPMSRYRALGFPVSIITSRGCPNACIFCQGRRMVGKKVRYRSVEYVMDEIERILSYGISRINIADDLFTSNKARVREICGEIRRRGLDFKWSAFSRVNTVDSEILELMRDAGCDSVSFGIESGNPEMLKRVKKGITLDQARDAVRMCKEAGILAHASFMVGLPGESPETLRDTLEFSNSLEIPHGYHFLAPFPGTTVREKIEEYDLEILTDDWAHYDANRAIVRTAALSPEDIESFVAAFDREINDEWEKQVRDYREGRGLPEDNFRVEGHFRMQLVYRILSEDLIETCGCFPMEHASDNGSVDRLCGGIAEVTGFDSRLVRNTIEDFIDAGYIKPGRAGDNIAWYWTHNNKVDVNDSVD